MQDYVSELENEDSDYSHFRDQKVHLENPDKDKAIDEEKIYVKTHDVDEIDD